MSDKENPFEKCTACGRWKGDHVVPSGLNGMFRVLICPERKVVDNFYQEYTAPVSDEPEDASPPPESQDAKELAQLKSTIRRVADHYYGQIFRMPLRDRETLARIVQDLDHMLGRNAPRRNGYKKRR